MFFQILRYQNCTEDKIKTSQELSTFLIHVNETSCSWNSKRKLSSHFLKENQTFNSSSRFFPDKRSPRVSEAKDINLNLNIKSNNPFHYLRARAAFDFNKRFNVIPKMSDTDLLISRYLNNTFIKLVHALFAPERERSVSIIFKVIT